MHKKIDRYLLNTNQLTKNILLMSFFALIQKLCSVFQEQFQTFCQLDEDLDDKFELEDTADAGRASGISCKSS